MQLKNFFGGTATPAPSTLSRVDYLDGWRGLAIALVLQAHFFGIHGFNSGRLGVDVFFVLSGLLMGNILFIKRTPLPLFYKRRASRVVPAFVLFVGATYFSGYFFKYAFEATEVLAVLTFMRTYLPLGADIWSSPLPIGHIWSLNIEEHGYILMSLLTLPVILRSREWTLLFLIGVATIAVQLAYIYRLLPAPTDFALRTECALTHLMLSAAYCQVADKVRHKVAPWMPFLAFLCTCFCYTQLFPWWSRVLVAPFLLAFAVNHLSETWQFVRTTLAHPLPRILGTWSYSIYLWQQPFYNNKALFPQGIALCLAIMVGMFSFYVIENPARAYLNSRW